MTDSHIHNPGEIFHPRIEDNFIIHIPEKVSPFLEISISSLCQTASKLFSFPCVNLWKHLRHLPGSYNWICQFLRQNIIELGVDFEQCSFYFYNML